MCPMKAKKVFPSIKYLAYQKTLKVRNLPSLKYKCDMITIYSIFHNIYDLHTSQIFTFPTYTNTRGHPFKIVKKTDITRCKSSHF